MRKEEEEKECAYQAMYMHCLLVRSNNSVKKPGAQTQLVFLLPPFSQSLYITSFSCFFSSANTKPKSSFLQISFLVQSQAIPSATKMSSTSRAWAVAASMGAVEALKDQGFCRWNHAFRSLQHHAKNNLGSFSQTMRLSSFVERISEGSEKAKQSEESLRKVMYLSCWGPN